MTTESHLPSLCQRWIGPIQRRRWVSLLALLALAAPVMGQMAEPVGEEFRINTPTLYKELEPVAAFSPDGGSYLVVWENARFGLLGRLFVGGKTDPMMGDVSLVENGPLPPNPGSGEFISAKHPAVVFHPSGDFFLFWTEDRSFLRLAIFSQSTTIQEQDIWGKRFTADGSPVGERFLVNSTTEGRQTRPQAALVDDETLLVVWQSTDPFQEDPGLDGVFAQALTLDGEPEDEEIKVSQGPVSTSPRPSLAVDSQGRALVVWSGRDADGDGVFARRFDRDLEVVGDEFQVNTTSENDQTSPAVATSVGGQFLVAWQNEIIANDEYRIFGQFVTRSGVLRGSEFQISADFGTGDGAPALTTSPTGTFVALWVIWTQNFPSVVAGIELNLAGRPLTEPFRVSLAKVDVNRKLAFAASASGEFIVAWEGVLERERGISGRLLEKHSAKLTPYFDGGLGRP